MKKLIYAKQLPNNAYIVISNDDVETIGEYMSQSEFLLKKLYPEEYDLDVSELEICAEPWINESIEITTFWNEIGEQEIQTNNLGIFYRLASALYNKGIVVDPETVDGTVYAFSLAKDALSNKGITLQDIVNEEFNSSIVKVKSFT